MGRDPDLSELDDLGLERRVRELVGDDAARVISTFREANSLSSCSDLLALIATGKRRYPIDSIVLAERKAERAAAPVFLYTLTWETTARRGAMRTPHALEIPLVFDNVAGNERFLGTNDPQSMANMMSSTWLAFAHTGDPNNNTIPSWPEFTSAERQSLIGNGQRFIAKRYRSFYEFFRVGGTAQEGEIAQGMKFGVTSPTHPKKPCKYQVDLRQRLRNTHSRIPCGLMAV